MIDFPPKHDMETGGVYFQFTRRRYPGVTYTWAKAWQNGDWIDLGDPWPCLTPKRAELLAALAEMLTRIERGEVRP